MENEKAQQTIFEQENYEGGMGSGPLASAPEEDDTATDPEEDAGDDREEELDIDA